LVSAREALEPKGELEETAGVGMVSFVGDLGGSYSRSLRTCSGKLSAQGSDAGGRVVFSVVKPDEVGDPAGKVR
jgi:hypothetical protein